MALFKQALLINKTYITHFTLIKVRLAQVAFVKPLDSCCTQSHLVTHMMMMMIVKTMEHTMLSHAGREHNYNKLALEKGKTI